MAKHNKKQSWTMKGVIVKATGIRDFTTCSGKAKQGAMLHIREDAEDDGSAQVAVKVTGELCNYVGCVGARVAVEYIVRVFDFEKDGVLLFANDIFAISIKMV